MSVSTHLELPFVAAAQSQKHVTVNEAFARLDVIVEANALDKDLAAPPASPAVGDRYIVGPSATGDWAGHEDEIASYDGSGWVFLPPQPGWKAWVQDEAQLYVFHGTAWTQLVTGDVTEIDLRDGSIDRIGVNTAADLTNRLAVKSDAVLLDHDGTDSRVKVNKAAAGNVASHLFQDGYSGRAEFGLIGDDDFSLKVSADGANFVEAFKVDRTTSAVDFNVTPRVNGELMGLEVGRFGQTINAYDYGLRESASAATNTAAINAAAQAVRDAVVVISGGTSNIFTPVIFRIPPGHYEIAEKSSASKVGLDFSMIRLNGRVIMDCRNAVLVTDATLTGKVVLDLIGSRWFSGFLPAIHTPDDSLIAPLTGIQFGRFSQSESCDEHHFTDIQVRGFFSRACVHNLHSETCVFENANVFNYFNAATAYAWIQDGWAHWLPESDADTSGMISDVSHSFLMNTFIGGAFRASSGSIGAAMHLGRARQHTFKNCYFVSSGLTTVEVANNVEDLRFEQCHFESSDIKHCVRFVDHIGDPAFLAAGMAFHETSANARDSIFGIDTALATVQLNDFHCSLRRFNFALTQGFFEAPAKVSVLGGHIALPNLTYWQPLAAFQGLLETPTSAERFGSLDFATVPTVGAVDRLLYTGKGLADQTIVLADDTATAVTLPANCTSNFVLAISAVNGTPGAAMVWVSLTLNQSAIMSQSAASYQTLDGTVLTGTTGTDGRTTLGVAGNTLYLENRMGGSRTYGLSFLANR